MSLSFGFYASSYIIYLFFSCVLVCDAFAYELTINPLVQNVFFSDGSSSEGSDRSLVKRVDLYDEIFGETEEGVSKFTEPEVEAVDLDVKDMHVQILIKGFIFGVIVIVNEFGRKEALLSEKIDAPFSCASILPFLMNAFALVDISRVIDALYLVNHELPLGSSLTEGASASKNLGDGEGKAEQETDCKNHLMTNSELRKNRKKLTLDLSAVKKSFRRDTEDLSALSRVVRIYTKPNASDNKRGEGWPYIKKMMWEDCLHVSPIVNRGHRMKSIVTKKYVENGEEKSVSIVVKLTSTSYIDLKRTYCGDISLVTFHQAFHDYLAIRFFEKELLIGGKLKVFVPQTKVICFKSDDVGCFFPQIKRDENFHFIYNALDQCGVIFALAQDYVEDTVFDEESMRGFSNELDFLNKKIKDFRIGEIKGNDSSNLKLSISRDIPVCFDVELDEIRDVDVVDAVHERFRYDGFEDVKGCSYLKDAFDPGVFSGVCFEQFSLSPFFFEKGVRSLSFSDSGVEIDCEKGDSEEELGDGSVFSD